jgi:hypothetical protein
MLQLARYERMEISLSNGLHEILTHRSFSSDFWPGFDTFWPTVHWRNILAEFRENRSNGSKA